MQVKPARFRRKCEENEILKAENAKLKARVEELESNRVFALYVVESVKKYGNSGFNNFGDSIEDLINESIKKLSQAVGKENKGEKK